MKLITFKTFDNPIEAHNFRNRLEAEDIEAYIYDEHIIGLNPLYSNAIGGIKVKIAENDLDQANLVLQAINSNQYYSDTRDILKCLSCDSEDVNTNYRDFKNLSGIVSFFASIVFMVYPIYFARKCKCNACDLEFNRTDIEY
ncbi:putative signal transducing protein [Sphingobacterium bovistauri]|uniref:DUF2007 domain-containing protein n=1 Tax=Sphingobacterium bovistauri TaxID=2781959 RepID=A0ABS7ZBW5_9SPHI|nr:DUF2007 domain-containing protein [Sphingobacterium bovistauri]MCA5006414.1 DUF2007 domain-containing protein [Sphingobacterium bovistauri]